MGRGWGFVWALHVQKVSERFLERCSRRSVGALEYSIPHSFHKISGRCKSLTEAKSFMIRMICTLLLAKALGVRWFHVPIRG